MAIYASIVAARRIPAQRCEFGQRATAEWVDLIIMLHTTAQVVVDMTQYLPDSRKSCPHEKRVHFTIVQVLSGVIGAA